MPARADALVGRLPLDRGGPPDRESRRADSCRAQFEAADLARVGAEESAHELGLAPILVGSQLFLHELLRPGGQGMVGRDPRL